MANTAGLADTVDLDAEEDNNVTGAARGTLLMTLLDNVSAVDSF